MLRLCPQDQKQLELKNCHCLEPNRAKILQTALQMQQRNETFAYHPVSISVNQTSTMQPTQIVQVNGQQYMMVSQPPRTESPQISNPPTPNLATCSSSQVQRRPVVVACFTGNNNMGYNPPLHQAVFPPMQSRPVSQCQPKPVSNAIKEQWKDISCSRANGSAAIWRRPPQPSHVPLVHVNNNVSFEGGSKVDGDLRTMAGIGPSPGSAGLTGPITDIIRGKKYSNFSIEHILGISCKKPKACHYCPKKFAHVSNLNAHVNAVHLNIRPFQCPICQKKFHYNSHRRAHENAVHFKLTNYQCVVCQKNFPRKASKVNHENSVHFNIKSFICRFCPTNFTQNVNKRRHEKQFHNELL